MRQAIVTFIRKAGEKFSEATFLLYIDESRSLLEIMEQAKQEANKESQSRGFSFCHLKNLQVAC